MYDIRQFLPALYSLVILGISSFCLVNEAPGLWVLAMAAIIYNMHLVRTGRFKPLPRWLAGLLALLSMAAVVYQLYASTQVPIYNIAVFLVLLQIVKLFEQRGNRDFAQVLILSLLLMVSATINSYQLYFGILFIIYIFLSLYCCLLFHLKSETDLARAAIGPSAEKLPAAALRYSQQNLNRSMRRLTLVVSTVSVAVAIAVFLFFPRRSGAGLLGVLFPPDQALTGFSDTVSHNDVARLVQNDEQVAYVELFQGDRRITDGRRLLLRGNVQDQYLGPDESGAPPWQWARSMTHEDGFDVQPGRQTGLRRTSGTDAIRQRIRLQPIGTPTLFAIAGAESITASRPLNLVYARRDQVLRADRPLMDMLQYEVVSSGELGGRESTVSSGFFGDYFFARRRYWSDGSRGPAPQTRRPLGPDVRLRQWAIDALGRDILEAPPSEVAQRLETYFKQEFTYTLDLTRYSRLEGADPLHWFVFDVRSGHCELFAGAMTRTMQALGIDARMVVGFSGGEFNAYGGYYVVRQSDAHAWVEVLTERGWQTYDPTSGRDAPAATGGGLLTTLRQFFNYLQFKYSSNVVAYDSSARESLLNNLQAQLNNASETRERLWADFRAWLYSASFWSTSMKFISGLIGLMVLAMLTAIGVYLHQSWRLRNRARRMGMGALPAAMQLRLARQLGFYDELIQMLERHELRRPKHLTPQEFADSLWQLPTDVYRSVRSLTRLFYRVRFGGHRMQLAQRRRLHGVVARLHEVLSARQQPVR